MAAVGRNGGLRRAAAAGKAAAGKVATGKAAAAVGKTPLRGGTYSGAEARNARDGVAAGTPPADGASAGDAGTANGDADADADADGVATAEAAR